MSTGPGAAPAAAATADAAETGATKPWRRRLRLAFALLVVLAISLGVALGLAEVAVRIVAPQQLIEIRPDVWMAADSIGWLRRPNVSTTINTGERTVSLLTDGEGYRIGREGRREAPAQLLYLGDSFVEAVQVDYEETAGALLERDLSRALGRPVAVRTAGVSGWSPNHYLIRTRQLLARDSFALIVVGVFVGNDAVQQRIAYVAPRAPAERASFRWPRSLSAREVINAWLAPVNDGLETRSHLYVLLKNQLATVRMRLGVTADYFPREFLRSEAASPRWRVTGDIARDLAQEAQRHGVPVLFVLIPERIQVYDDELERHLRGFAISRDSVDLDQPSRMLDSIFTGDQLHVVNGLPAFRDSARTGERLFGRVDQHLSPRGHRVLSAVMEPAAAALLSPRPAARRR